MTPRYIVLTKAADNASLSELPSRETFHGDQGEVEMLPRTIPETLRPTLVELLEDDLVRIYVGDRNQDVAEYHPRILSTAKAIEVAEQDWSSHWATNGWEYRLVTTPRGDEEWEREWEANGKPPALIGRQTIVFINVATAPRRP